MGRCYPRRCLDGSRWLAYDKGEWQPKMALLDKNVEKKSDSPGSFRLEEQ
jgi:hypothetical protein